MFAEIYGLWDIYPKKLEMDDSSYNKINHIFYK